MSRGHSSKRLPINRGTRVIQTATAVIAELIFIGVFISDIPTTNHDLDLLCYLICSLNVRNVTASIPEFAPAPLPFGYPIASKLIVPSATDRPCNGCSQNPTRIRRIVDEVKCALAIEELCDL